MNLSPSGTACVKILHMPSLRDSMMYFHPNLGLKSQATTYRSSGTKKVKRQSPRVGVKE